MNELQKKLLEAMEKHAERNGLEMITKTIHFNNDVPKFLKKLEEFKERSRNSSFIVKYSTSEITYH